MAFAVGRISKCTLKSKLLVFLFCSPEVGLSYHVKCADRSAPSPNLRVSENRPIVIFETRVQTLLIEFSCRLPPHSSFPLRHRLALRRPVLARAVRRPAFARHSGRGIIAPVLFAALAHVLGVLFFRSPLPFLLPPSASACAVPPPDGCCCCPGRSPSLHLLRCSGGGGGALENDVCGWSYLIADMRSVILR